jgi:hypothetical protein
MLFNPIGVNSPLEMVLNSVPLPFNLTLIRFGELRSMTLILRPITKTGGEIRPALRGIVQTYRAKFEA